MNNQIIPYDTKFAMFQNKNKKIIFTNQNIYGTYYNTQELDYKNNIYIFNSGFRIINGKTYLVNNCFSN